MLGEKMSLRFADTNCCDACTGMIECYNNAGAFGQISGRVTSHVGTDGHMVDASYEGDAKPHTGPLAVFLDLVTMRETNGKLEITVLSDSVAVMLNVTGDEP